MTQWSAGLLPAPLNRAPGFKQLEQAINEPLTLPLLPVYANNAAALVGGLVAGALYRTATGQVMVTF